MWPQQKRSEERQGRFTLIVSLSCLRRRRRPAWTSIPPRRRIEGGTNPMPKRPKKKMGAIVVLCGAAICPQQGGWITITSDLFFIVGVVAGGVEFGFGFSSSEATTQRKRSTAHSRSCIIACAWVSVLQPTPQITGCDSVPIYPANKSTIGNTFFFVSSLELYLTLRYQQSRLFLLFPMQYTELRTNMHILWMGININSYYALTNRAR